MRPGGVGLRFQSIDIRNFRAIQRFSVGDLSDLILIAGPNGCGKSCILDAIRLLKSVYGGYQTNEWMQWFGEFQVNLNDPNNLRGVFRDKQIPIQISAVIQLAAAETAFLAEHAYPLCEPIIWAEVTRLPMEAYLYSPLAYAAQYPALVPEVAQRCTDTAAKLQSEVAKATHSLSLTLFPTGQLLTSPSLVAKVIFQTYDPEHLGIIDFHSASRTYAREAIGGINLDVKALETQRRTQTLYNWQAKYQNIKSELVTMYVRSLVSQQAGGPDNASQTLDETLKELFRTFFPEKEYLGVQASEDETSASRFASRPWKRTISMTSALERRRSCTVTFVYAVRRRATPRSCSTSQSST